MLELRPAPELAVRVEPPLEERLPLEVLRLPLGLLWLELPWLELLWCEDDE